MKLNTFAVVIGTSAVVLTGCETPYGTPDRTATGALTGRIRALPPGAPASRRLFASPPGRVPNIFFAQSGEPGQCQDAPALTGGAIGVASGALLGGRHAGPAALVGGALGAVAGGLIGHSMDQQAQARLRQQAPQTYTRLDQGQPLNLADVKALAAAKVSDEVIL